MKLFFKDGEQNYVPIAEATIYNPVGDRSIKVELVIDTGFQGGVLLPLQTYVSLGLQLFEELKVIGQTATGNVVELRVSKVIIKLGNLKLMCRTYTTLGVRRSLLGREVLKRIGFTYKPPEILKLDD